MPLLDVDTARGRFDHTCLNCQVTQRGLRLGMDITIALGEDAETEHARLLYVCPLCGAVETFFDHGEQHEIAGYVREVPLDEKSGVVTHPIDHYHAEQTQLIRAAKRHLGAPLRGSTR